MSAAGCHRMGDRLVGLSHELLLVSEPLMRSNHKSLLNGDHISIDGGLRFDNTRLFCLLQSPLCDKPAT